MRTLVHIGAVVADAPSPLSTPRTRSQGKVGGAARLGGLLAALWVAIKMSTFRPSSAFATQGVRAVGTLGRVPPTIPAFGGFTCACYGQLPSGNSTELAEFWEPFARSFTALCASMCLSTPSGASAVTNSCTSIARTSAISAGY